MHDFMHCAAATIGGLEMVTTDFSYDTMEYAMYLHVRTSLVLVNFTEFKFQCVLVHVLSRYLSLRHTVGVIFHCYLGWQSKYQFSCLCDLGMILRKEVGGELHNRFTSSMCIDL